MDTNKKVRTDVDIFEGELESPGPKVTIPEGVKPFTGNKIFTVYVTVGFELLVPTLEEAEDFADELAVEITALEKLSDSRVEEKWSDGSSFYENDQEVGS